MLILPAIDLLDGRCVRLRQGRFDDVTLYSDDPVAVARGFVEQGAEALHVVDLEGARLGKAKNLEWIYRIRKGVPVFLQVGGGIRTFALATRLLHGGIDRVVCATVAAEDPRLLARLLERYGPDYVAAGLDLREGRAVVRGWESESTRSLDDLLSDLRELGARWVVCTDVTRDGTQAGPGPDAAQRLVAEGFQVIVAGGIATLEHVARLRELGAAGCIIGSALYEGTLRLSDALECARAG
ncbi:MAG: 1-(5-phosphoribosyl)-5-[(5-phosphoribosylamino)methylideneamino] imidazole-4-carboxamide isomerase [Gemmatimonadetes bacterium]|nr:1-(5-phosphoribosyl)-5-[(5-phosphoribosylamino)methylideneamino] imidazole-4-carboxamide isomerase [Gemmatimonadota bacterium]